MKRTIRLTESDLHRVIKESVNKLLNEWDFYTDEPDESDYYAEEIENAERLARRIINGQYDKYMTPNEIGGFERRVLSNLDVDNGTYDIVNNAIHSRYYSLNKDAANDYLNRLDKERESDKQYQMRSMFNSRNNDYRKKEEIDKAWDEKNRKDAAKKYPALHKKNGEARSVNQISKWIRSNGGVADERPLHRKGSLNRAFD